MIGKKVQLTNGAIVRILDKVLSSEKEQTVDKYLVQVLEVGVLNKIGVILPTSIKAILPDGE